MKKSEQLFRCDTCQHEMTYAEMEVLGWSDYLGNDEEIWKCPNCGSNSINEIDEDEYLFI